MEQVYYWIGFIVFWLFTIVGFIFILWFAGELLLDELGRRLKTVWVIVEYARYRKKFKEWKQINKIQSYENNRRRG